MSAGTSQRPSDKGRSEQSMPGFGSVESLLHSPRTPEGPPRGSVAHLASTSSGSPGDESPFEADGMTRTNTALPHSLPERLAEFEKVKAAVTASPPPPTEFVGATQPPHGSKSAYVNTERIGIPEDHSNTSSSPAVSPATANPALRSALKSLNSMPIRLTEKDHRDAELLAYHLFVAWQYGWLEPSNVSAAPALIFLGERPAHFDDHCMNVSFPALVQQYLSLQHFVTPVKHEWPEVGCMVPTDFAVRPWNRDEFIKYDTPTRRRTVLYISDETKKSLAPTIVESMDMCVVTHGGHYTQTERAAKTLSDQEIQNLDGCLDRVTYCPRRGLDNHDPKGCGLVHRCDELPAVSSRDGRRVLRCSVAIQGQETRWCTQPTDCDLTVCTYLHFKSFQRVSTPTSQLASESSRETATAFPSRNRRLTPRFSTSVHPPMLCTNGDEFWPRYKFNAVGNGAATLYQIIIVANTCDAAQDMARLLGMAHFNQIDDWVRGHIVFHHRGSLAMIEAWCTSTNKLSDLAKKPQFVSPNFASLVHDTKSLVPFEDIQWSRVLSWSEIDKADKPRQRRHDLRGMSDDALNQLTTTCCMSRCDVVSRIKTLTGADFTLPEGTLIHATTAAPNDASFRPAKPDAVASSMLLLVGDESKAKRGLLDLLTLPRDEQSAPYAVYLCTRPTPRGGPDEVIEVWSVGGDEEFHQVSETVLRDLWEFGVSPQVNTDVDAEEIQSPLTSMGVIDASHKPLAVIIVDENSPNHQERAHYWTSMLRRAEFKPDAIVMVTFDPTKVGNDFGLVSISGQTHSGGFVTTIPPRSRNRSDGNDITKTAVRQVMAIVDMLHGSDGPRTAATRGTRICDDRGLIDASAFLQTSPSAHQVLEHYRLGYPCTSSTAESAPLNVLTQETRAQEEISVAVPLLCSVHPPECIEAHYPTFIFSCETLAFSALQLWDFVIELDGLLHSSQNTSVLMWRDGRYWVPKDADATSLWASIEWHWSSRASDSNSRQLAIVISTGDPRRAMRFEILQLIHRKLGVMPIFGKKAQLSGPRARTVNSQLDFARDLNGLCDLHTHLTGMGSHEYWFDCVMTSMIPAVRNARAINTSRRNRLSHMFCSGKTTIRDGGYQVSVDEVCGKVLKAEYAFDRLYTDDVVYGEDDLCKAFFGCGAGALPEAEGRVLPADRLWKLELLLTNQNSRAVFKNHWRTYLVYNEKKREFQRITGLPNAFFEAVLEVDRADRSAQAKAIEGKVRNCFTMLNRDGTVPREADLYAYRGNFTPEFYPMRYALKDPMLDQVLILWPLLINHLAQRYVAAGVSYVEFSVSNNDVLCERLMDACCNFSFDGCNPSFNQLAQQVDPSVAPSPMPATPPRVVRNSGKVRPCVARAVKMAAGSASPTRLPATCEPSNDDVEVSIDYLRFGDDPFPEFYKLIPRHCASTWQWNLRGPFAFRFLAAYPRSKAALPNLLQWLRDSMPFVYARRSPRAAPAIPPASVEPAPQSTSIRTRQSVATPEAFFNAVTDVFREFQENSPQRTSRDGSTSPDSKSAADEAISQFMPDNGASVPPQLRRELTAAIAPFYPIKMGEICQLLFGKTPLAKLHGLMCPTEGQTLHSRLALKFVVGIDNNSEEDGFPFSAFVSDDSVKCLVAMHKARNHACDGASFGVRLHGGEGMRRGSYATAENRILEVNFLAHLHIIHAEVERLRLAGLSVRIGHGVAFLANDVEFTPAVRGDYIHTMPFHWNVPRLLRSLRDLRVPFELNMTSNETLMTDMCGNSSLPTLLPTQVLRRMLDENLVVILSTDDDGIWRCEFTVGYHVRVSVAAEFAKAIDNGCFNSIDEIRMVAHNARIFAFDPITVSDCDVRS